MKVNTNEKSVLNVAQPVNGESFIMDLTRHSSWQEMAGSNHFVQFYETTEFLLDSVGKFVSVTLGGGDSSVVVATQPLLDNLENSLRANGWDLDAARASGQYITMDAAETLSQFTVDGEPVPERFAELMSGTIARARVGNRRVRIYGEMVALLCAEGNYEAAIRLEELWNKLQENTAFTLLCAYPMKTFCGEPLAEPLNRICAGHTQVIPAESYTALKNGDERHREITLLQQKAKTLTAEIEERKRAQAALHRREAELTDFIENATDGLHWVGADGLIQWANRAEMELLGYTSEEYIGQHVSNFHADKAAISDILNRLSRGEELHNYEARLRAKDGSIRHVLINSNVYWENGKFVHTRCFTRDITKRKEAEDSLHQVKEKLEVQVEDLRRLHEMSISLTGMTDVESVLKEVLRAAMDMQGTDLGFLSLCDSEETGLNLKVQSGFDDALDLVEWVSSGNGACGRCLAERRRVIVEDVEESLIFAPHMEVPRRVGFRACHNTPLLTRGGKIIGVLSVHFRQRHRPSEREARLMDLYARMAADVIENARLHERVQQELEKREQLLVREQLARAEAETANRMKDEFLATISHELRTPLTAIMGWSHMIRSKNLDSETSLRALEIIERNAQSQAQLVEDILDVSRIITGKLRLNVSEVDLASVINSAVDSVQLAADSRGIQLEVTLEPSARRVPGDANRLQQVVWNLLSNAIKFTPAGGSVEVKLERAGRHAQISVTDTGSGIHVDFLPYVFDRFRQADGSSTRRHGGLGLGLAIVRHLVELHGGSAHVDSPGEGQGSTFTINLPLAPAKERTASRRKERRSILGKREGTVADESLPLLEGVRVLLVDDDQDTLQILAVMLTESKAIVHTATTVAQALEVFRLHRPDILVSDLALPNEDGYSLIGKVRESSSEECQLIPAVALTAYVRVEDRRRALEAGFNMFLPKPVEPNELVITIANLVRQSVAELP